MVNDKERTQRVTDADSAQTSPELKERRQRETLIRLSAHVVQDLDHVHHVLIV